MNKEINHSLHLFRVLARAYRSVSQHSLKSSKSHGFNPTEFAVLELLYNKGRQPLQMIGNQLLLVSGGVTYVIDKLEKAGFLFRETCETDRRVIYAVLSEKGIQKMEEIFPLHSKTINRALTGLTEREKDELITLLKKMGYEAQKLLND
jgi:MarR family 2-MHQ and catechol resistance regulon transcriptional repressor